MAARSSAVIWEHERVVHFIQGYEYSRITLQFPDDLLQHAPAVAQDLQQLLVQNGSGAKVRAIMPLPRR
jgi:diphthamide biosynthesis enzyme Dph1/Dph2-like protein